MAKLSQGVETGEAFQHLAMRCLAQVARHEPGALQRDAEALHKMRVGVRRLRSVFTTFKPAIEEAEVQDLRDELRWLQGVLGRCRDWDVFNAANVSPLGERLGDDERFRRFAELGLRARDEAYDALDEAMTSGRYSAVHERFYDLLDDTVRIATPWMGRPLGKFARRVMKKRLRKVAVSAGDLAVMPLAELHELRKQIKKAHYALGFFSDLYRRKRARRYLEQLSLIQDLLGQMVDVRAGRDLVEGLRAGNGSDRRALEAGRYLVIGWMTANAEDCRPRVRQAWEQYQSLKRLT
jgi:triphosphatase